jgi:hypothetical protein
LNRKELQKRLGPVTSELLREKGYISFVDVFIKLEYLDLKDHDLWRMKKIPYLEKAIKLNPGKINFIMKTVRKNSLHGQLKFSWTGYKSWGKKKKVFLQFTKSGEKNIEKLYATHFVAKEK